ncbi:hypothetical protein ON010_g18128 [Phytophthora cinnamomi]|nr:hypothetical protein ON010_g18128 [Phytophthora cinnamomi]
MHHHEAAVTIIREMRSSNLSGATIVATLETLMLETREAEDLLLEETRKVLEDLRGESEVPAALGQLQRPMLARSQEPSDQVVVSAQPALVQTAHGVRSNLGADEGTRTSKELVYIGLPTSC